MSGSAGDASSTGVVERGRLLVVCCAAGVRSELEPSFELLRARGFEIAILEDGEVWRAATIEQVRRHGAAAIYVLAKSADDGSGGARLANVFRKMRTPGRASRRDTIAQARIRGELGIHEGIVYAPLESPKLDFHAAAAMCEEMNHGEHEGWRMPTLGEIHVLAAAHVVERGVYWSGTEPDAFPGRGFVWSGKHGPLRSGRSGTAPGPSAFWTIRKRTDRPTREPEHPV